MGERRLCTAEVGSSNLPGSTRSLNAGLRRFVRLVDVKGLRADRTRDRIVGLEG